VAPNAFCVVMARSWWTKSRVTNIVPTRLPGAPDHELSPCPPGRQGGPSGSYQLKLYPATGAYHVSLALAAAVIGTVGVALSLAGPELRGEGSPQADLKRAGIVVGVSGFPL